MKVEYLFKEGAIQDGVLQDCGRIIIQGDQILISFNRADDHNAMLRAFASRYRVDRHEVINKAVRLYFKIEGETVTVSGVRKVDNEAVRSDLHLYGQMIEREIGWRSGVRFRKA